MKIAKPCFFSGRRRPGRDYVETGTEVHLLKPDLTWKKKIQQRQQRARAIEVRS
jgi:hypothetical protein